MRRGKCQRQRRAAGIGVFERDCSSVFAHDPMSHGESDAGVTRFGREKQLKDVRECIGAHRRSIVVQL